MKKYVLKRSRREVIQVSTPWYGFAVNVARYDNIADKTHFEKRRIVYHFRMLCSAVFVQLRTLVRAQ